MLKILRESSGLSQSELSRASGVSLRTLQAYESGSRDINGASLITLCRLALALNCSISDLLTDQELVDLFHSVF